MQPLSSERNSPSTTQDTVTEVAEYYGSISTGSKIVSLLTEIRDLLAAQSGTHYCKLTQ